ncbi:MAG TPA: hypothetical protein VJH37_01090 [Candidatus Nanoarchaeia archaeon]|nr:hypothetical protein [Candidatus Nanoarchaeia archaeon]
MKKRGLISLLVLVAVICLPSVVASISLIGPEQTTFNFGDSLEISGTALETADINGVLKYELDCGETELLVTKSVSLRANIEKSFTETFTIPQTLTGSCALHVFVESNGNLQDESLSTAFTITETLNAEITLDKESVQLGDSVTLKGIITKMDGKAIEGLAKIAFKTGSDIVVQDTMKVNKGKFSYVFETEDNPSGSYEVTVEVTDINNNRQTTSLNTLQLLGDVGLIITLNNNEFLPGEKINIDGTARTGDARILKGTAYITLDNQREETTILLGVLKHTLTLPEYIKTGDHTLTINVEDTHGNKETQQFTITIIAVSTRLEMVMNQEAFMPEQQVVIKPTLFDQGNDIIAADIALEVYDAEKDIVFTDTIQSAKQTQFTLPRSAAPGFWRMKAAGMDVNAFASFKVEDFKMVEIIQEESSIIFANTGNVPSREIMTIKLTDKNDPARVIMKEKKVSLGVGDQKVYDLAYWVPKGMYTVQVGDKVFDNVEVQKRKWDVMPYIAVILAIGIIYMLTKMYLTRAQKQHSTHYGHQNHHLQAGQYNKPKQHQQEQPVHRNRTEKWYEEKLKRDLAERMEEKRSKVQFSFSKRKNEYVEALHKKKKSADVSRPWVRKPMKQAEAEPEVFMNSQEFSDPWKTTEEQQKKEDKEKKGSSLMGMFD